MNFNKPKTIHDILILIMYKQGYIEPKNDIGWLRDCHIVKKYRDLYNALSYLKRKNDRESLAKNRTYGYWTLTDKGESEVHKLMQQYGDDMRIPTRRDHSFWKNVLENVEHKDEILIDDHKVMIFNVQTNDYQLNIAFNNGSVIKIA